MNHLFFGDHLAVLRQHIADASEDVINPGPPFNSNPSYNVPFTGPEGTEIEAFRCAALLRAGKP